MQRKPIVIAYDIHNPLRRRRVHQRLAQWRIDGQKSVHECLLTEREAEELYAQLCELIEPASDRLLLSWLIPGGQIDGRGQGQTDSFFRRLVRVH